MSAACVLYEVWVENAVYQHILYIGFDMKLHDILCAAAADLQINRFLEAFHVARPGMTHADTICSYSTSWETLIFKTFGSYDSLQLSSTLRLPVIPTTFESVRTFYQQMSDTALLLTCKTEHECLGFL